MTDDGPDAFFERTQREIRAAATQDPATCKHESFTAVTAVARLSEPEAGGVDFMLELRMFCVDCGKGFQFLGLEPGVDLRGARVSLDGLTASMAICPEGVRPSPLQMLGFNITRFDA